MEVGDHLTLHLQFIEQATVLWEVVCSCSVKLDLMFFFHFNSVCFSFHVSFYTIGRYTVASNVLATRQACSHEFYGLNWKSWEDRR